MPRLVSSRRLRRAGSEADDYFGSDGVELAQQIWRAGFDFVGFGQAIFRRAALDDVADVYVFALQAHRFDHLRQQFSGAADKGKALGIFVAARPFAYENQVGFGLPSPKTILFRVVWSLQRVHSPRSSRILSSESSATLFRASNRETLGAR